MFSSSAGKPSPDEGKVVIDRSAAPLLRVRMVGSPSMEAFEAYLQEMASLVRRGPYASVYDARQSSVSRASLRKRQADWIRDNIDVIRQNCAGVAFCASSPLVRGAITAVFWLQPPPSPHFVTDDIAEAERWARERLAIRLAKKA